MWSLKVSPLERPRQPLFNWTILAFGAFPGCVTTCSRLYPYLTISAQASESNELRREMSPFSLLLSSFSGTQRISGYVRPQWIVAVHPLKSGKRRPRLWGAFEDAFELGQPLRGIVT